MALTLIFEGVANDGKLIVNGVAKCTMRCFACGGKPPYTWTVSKGTIAVDPGTLSATVTAPATTNPAGQAYGFAVKHCGAGGFVGCSCVFYNCDGSLNTACSGAGCGPCISIATPGCSCVGSCDACTDVKLLAFVVPCTTCGVPIVVDDCATLGFVGLGHFCDTRTPGMISAGCNPCPIALNGAIVTLTDSTGAVVTRSLQTGP